jgi:uncharacterized protein YxjI
MLTRNNFFIKEHVGLFKLSNAYDIIDPETNRKIGLAQEVVPGWVHLLGFVINRRILPTRVDIIENPDDHGHGKVVVSIKRGVTLLRSKVRVLANGDTDIGYFKSKLFAIGGGFWLFDANEQKIAEVKGDWKGWNFKLLDTTGAELGTITKKWAGIGKEMFTSADNYMIAINEQSSAKPGVKALLLAAGIAIDTIYKEN